MSPLPVLDSPAEAAWYWPGNGVPATIGRRGGAGPGIGPSQEAPGDRAATPWHPDSPVFWGALLVAAVAVGLVAVEGGVRVGPFRARAEAGREP